MELQLGLTLSSKGFDLNQECDTNKRKRCFEEAFVDVEKNVKVLKTLPLLVWELEEQEVTQELINPNRNVDEVEDDTQVVGWPPVRSWRKNLLRQNSRGGAANYVTVENGGGCGCGSNSMYVKVKMEGVGITRKIDLSSHTSYQTLVTNLIAMFGKCEENVDMYKLTYQDQEGDWMLAGDVPWGSFIRSVQRLKLLKNDD